MENKHTPGPWFVSKSDDKTTGLLIKPIPAAPDLFKALDLWVFQIQRGRQITEDHLIFKDALNAIKKATE